MKRLAVLGAAALILPVVSCGTSGQSNQSALHASQNVATGIPDDLSQYWKPPAGASEKDGALIVEWFKSNDGCVGGEDPKVYEPICKVRDGLGDRLRKHGWCWGAPLDKSAADDDWHRCGTYDSDDESNAHADVGRGLAYLHTDDVGQSAPDDHPITSPGVSRAGDWYKEQHRQKSPLLQAYENAVEPIDQKTGLANVLVTCGIRGDAWHQQILSGLDQLRHSQSNEEMRQRLTPADAATAQRFDQIVIDGETHFNLGGRSKEAACRSIANMPWASGTVPF